MLLRHYATTSPPLHYAAAGTLMMMRDDIAAVAAAITLLCHAPCLLMPRRSAAYAIYADIAISLRHGHYAVTPYADVCYAIIEGDMIKRYYGARYDEAALMMPRRFFRALLRHTCDARYATAAP